MNSILNCSTLPLIQATHRPYNRLKQTVAWLTWLMSVVVLNHNVLITMLRLPRASIQANPSMQKAPP
ncbi:MAG: hypothetical protein EA367_14810, partial [Leptolyngbya sp. DLM2.Bin15]